MWLNTLNTVERLVVLKESSAAQVRWTEHSRVKKLTLNGFFFFAEADPLKYETNL